MGHILQKLTRIGAYTIDHLCPKYRRQSTYKYNFVVTEPPRQGVYLAWMNTHRNKTERDRDKTDRQTDSSPIYIYQVVTEPLRQGVCSIWMNTSRKEAEKDK